MVTTFLLFVWYDSHYGTDATGKKQQKSATIATVPPSIIDPTDLL